MNITLDGKIFQASTKFSDWNDFIKIICLDLLKDNLGVVSIAVDGNQLPVFTVEELGKFDIDSVRLVEITSKNVYETISAVFTEILGILPETEEFHSQVASMINEGTEKEALRILELVLKFWQNLISVIRTVFDITNAKNMVLPGTKDISREFQELSNISQQIKSYIASGDYVSIADTVENLLKPKVWVWKDIIQDTSDYINSKVV